MSVTHELANRVCSNESAPNALLALTGQSWGEGPDLIGGVGAVLAGGAAIGSIRPGLRGVRSKPTTLVGARVWTKAIGVSLGVHALALIAVLTWPAPAPEPTLADATPVEIVVEKQTVAAPSSPPAPLVEAPPPMAPPLAAPEVAVDGPPTPPRPAAAETPALVAGPVPDAKTEPAPPIPRPAIAVIPSPSVAAPAEQPAEVATPEPFVALGLPISRGDARARARAVAGRTAARSRAFPRGNTPAPACAKRFPSTGSTTCGPDAGAEVASARAGSVAPVRSTAKIHRAGARATRASSDEDRLWRFRQASASLPAIRSRFRRGSRRISAGRHCEAFRRQTLSGRRARARASRRRHRQLFDRRVGYGRRGLNRPIGRRFGSRRRGAGDSAPRESIPAAPERRDANIFSTAQLQNPLAPFSTAIRSLPAIWRAARSSASVRQRVWIRVRAS